MKRYQSIESDVFVPVQYLVEECSYNVYRKQDVAEEIFVRAAPNSTHYSV